MDILDAYNSIGNNYRSPEGASWAERLNSIALPGLAPQISKFYLDRLLPIYQRLGTGNIIRDILCNIAVQQSVQRIKPWASPFKGAFVQYGGLGSSSFLAAILSNWRIQSYYSVGRLSLELNNIDLENEKLTDEINRLKSENLVGEFSLVSEEIDSLVSKLMALNNNYGAVLHIADVTSIDIAFKTLVILTPIIRRGDIVLWSGSKDILEEFTKHVLYIFKDKFVRLISTITINANSPDREEALLMIRGSYPVRDLADQSIRMFDRIRESKLIFDQDKLSYYSDQIDFKKEGIYSFVGEYLKRPSECFSLKGYDVPLSKYTGGYREFPIAESSENNPSRFLKSFGEIVCLPGGGAINGIPISSKGLIPYQGIVGTILGQFDNPDHWLWQNNLPHFPVKELQGTWIILPTPGGALSHWLVEVFLPLLAFESLGHDFNVLVNGPFEEYQKHYMSLAGFNSDRIVHSEENTLYRCQTLIAPLREKIPISMGIRIHHPYSAFKIDSLMHSHDPKPRKRIEKIYVSRMDCRYARACVNEEEVILMVSQRGYKIVNGSTLTSSQALSLYGQARVIVGPYGAGLLNGIFSPQGCQIVSYMARPYREEHLEQVCRLMGHDYAYIACEYFHACDPEEGGARLSNYVADLNVIAAALENAEERAKIRD